LTMFVINESRFASTINPERMILFSPIHLIPLSQLHVLELSEPPARLRPVLLIKPCCAIRKKRISLKDHLAHA